VLRDDARLGGYNLVYVYKVEVITFGCELLGILTTDAICCASDQCPRLTAGYLTQVLTAKTHSQKLLY
jgi:hypothetical protein